MKRVQVIHKEVFCRESESLVKLNGDKIGNVRVGLIMNLKLKIKWPGAHAVADRSRWIVL